VGDYCVTRLHAMRQPAVYNYFVVPSSYAPGDDTRHNKVKRYLFIAIPEQSPHSL
jgi:hypothetical protein